MSPAVHMWRGYERALGVYIKINCALWASRLSKSGQPFSNLKMDEHIARCKFGLNEAGVDVSLLGASSAGASAAPSVAVAAASDAAVDAVINDAVTAAAAAAPPSAAAAAPSAPSANPRSGTYVDGIRIPWWFHDARVHDSDAAVLYRKDPVHYKQFSAHSPRFSDYVWPRDINPLHPEQKEELDALAAEIAAEEATKEKAKGAKKQKGKKRARASSTEDESSQAAEQSDAADDAGVEGGSVGHATVRESASHTSPSRRSPRASASASVVSQSPLSSSATPYRRGRRAAAAALEEITDDVVNVDTAQESTGEQVRKRRRTTADADTRASKAAQTANKPRTRRELKL